MTFQCCMCGNKINADIFDKDGTEIVVCLECLFDEPNERTQKYVKKHMSPRCEICDVEIEPLQNMCDDCYKTQKI